MEPRIQYAKTEDGVSIAYWTMGKGTPLLVTPHSPSSWSLRSWQNPEARAYYEKVTRGRLVIHYDHRGSGNSEHDISEQSIETLVADIEAVANDVGLEEFALLGSYICAPYAIAYAARHSERISKLIVLHASARGADFYNLDRLRKARESADEDPEFYLQIMGHNVYGGFGGKQAESWVSTMLKEGNLHVFQMTLDTIIETDVMELLPQVEAPTLVLHRREVQYPSLDAARTLARGIPSAQLVVLEGDSLIHYSGDSDSFVSAINEFLGAGPAAYGRGAAADTTRISSPPEAKTFASGRYVVKRLLGQGTQKSVYLVDDTTLERECALSVLNPALLDPGDVDRIKREAQTMAQFGTQPNIVTVYDYGEENDAPFIVCEYVPGGELRDELAAAEGPLPPERALAVATDICQALEFAHGEDIVHRDLKPENIWLTKDGSAKLGDFGIALSLGRTRLTMPGGITGTATYMAPEQVSGGDVDARSDLYALGVLMYELVTGRPPFVGDDPNSIMYQHVNTEPESPVEHNDAVPPSLEGLIMRLLAKEKTERPASAEEVLAELEEAASELADDASTATVRNAPASGPIEQEIRFCTSADGTRIAYATYGNDAARALVYVPSVDVAQEPAWNSSWRRALYEGLASARRLVTFDRRGLGSSQRDVDDLTIPAQVDDFVAVIDQLGLESVDLITSGTGGVLAAACAAEHPERVGRLVLWNTLINTSDSPLAGYQEMAQSIRANWSFARRSMAAILFPNGPTDLQRWYSDMLRDSIAPEVAARYYEVIAEFDGRTILKSVQAPTLVLANSDAHELEAAYVRAVASLIPDARLVTLEGDAGTQFGDPSQALAAIRNFLDEADGESEAAT